MKRFAVISCIIIIIVGLAGSACTRKPAKVALDDMTTMQMVDAAMNAAIKAHLQRVPGNKKERRHWAENGMAYADRCVEVAPNTPECYYWRAVNTGLYHSVKIIGYQDGIKQMIADCNAVIAMGRESYDNAGPWRIQGQIFTKLPETGGRPDSITRDLDKALDYLFRAVELAPNYPENRIALAEALYKEGRPDEAREELTIAQEEAPNWKVDSSYPEWERTIAKLMKKIGKKK